MSPARTRRRRRRPAAYRQPARFRWQHVSNPNGAAIEQRIAAVLDAWRDTPYRIGNQVRGEGVDCVRYVTGVLDDLVGYRRVPLASLPDDACLHSREGAFAAMREILRIYHELAPVEGDDIEPADILVVGPRGGGPGHAMIVGSQPNTIWHAGVERVHATGMTAPGEYEFFGVYRWSSRGDWLPGDASEERA